MSDIERAYRSKTRHSAHAMARAKQVVPGGLTRYVGFHMPYPPVMDRADGAYLYDLDGNRYADLMYNGLSLIHGHAYAPVVNALAAQTPKGWAWLGTSNAQIAFAEAICGRLSAVERVVFTNSGTEAGMLAVKLARRFTRRPYILKARGGYHGTFTDLEAGLHGTGAIPGRALLATFNDIASFERELHNHPGQVAAIIVESVMYTGVVETPENGFLQGLQELARLHKVLFILDDCLMLRLASGGSAEKFGLHPDLTVLGKFVGGGIPVGVVGGRSEIVDLADPGDPKGVYHGGSFNGNLLGAIAGLISLEHLTQEKIDAMDQRVERLRYALRDKAALLGLPLRMQGAGSVLGLYFSTRPLVGGEDIPHPDVSTLFHLACLNRGVQMGPGGLAAWATVATDTVVDEVVCAMGAALGDVVNDDSQCVEVLMKSLALST